MLRIRKRTTNNGGIQMILNIDLLWVGIGLIIYSFVQGLGYAVATWFFQKRIEKHFNIIENKLRGDQDGKDIQSTS